VTVCINVLIQIRQRVLSSAYMRAMKDPFPPARQAGILAMAATHNYFTLAESAQKLLPALCYLTTDPDKGVRDQVSLHLLSFNNIAYILSFRAYSTGSVLLHLVQRGGAWAGCGPTQSLLATSVAYIPRSIHWPLYFPPF